MSTDPKRQATENIPARLAAYVVKQEPTLYTAMDHASWRYILNVSRNYFAQFAHQKYLDGLRETGISSDQIPLISEMDASLRKFGWRAVAVSGFIPPAVFMEFFSLGVLPIACDMRKIENLAYTPAPDIVHEAAGHAPIIADPEYAAYLRLYGEISRKAIYSDQDMAVYHAIRALSEIKEDPKATQMQITAAQRRLDEAGNAVDHLSEATLLARMNWWTVEYGLIGSIEDPKIYGAGLLSSLGESYHCLEKQVQRIPFSIECIQIPYDITRPQPQLFVARSFQHLAQVLEEFADSMAFRRGGREGLDKARRARTVTTMELDSGIQISGKVVSWLEDEGGSPVFLRCEGPVQLSREGVQIQGQGADYHAQGFSSVIGKLKGREISPVQLTEAELQGLARLEFESGITVEGRLKNHLRVEGQNFILSFEDCSVTRGEEVLFKPEWGPYDLACGQRVVSVTGGPADYIAYVEATGGVRPATLKQKSNLTDENRDLNDLYARVRSLRDAGAKKEETLNELTKIIAERNARHPADWLLAYECLELVKNLEMNASWAGEVREGLDELAHGSGAAAEVVARGLKIL